MIYTYKTNKTCSRQIIVNVEKDIIKEVKFIGGCSGNTQGISSLVKGMKVEDVINKCQGINCADRGTSCPDQLCKALKEIIQIQ